MGIFLITAPSFWPAIGILPIYGVLVFGYITGKMAFSEIYRRTYKAPPIDPDRESDIAIAFFNEDAELLIRSIRSGLEQNNVHIGRVVLCDDGSKSDATFKAVRQAFDGDDRVVAIRVEQNRGKRHALATCFEHTKSEFVVLVDSDTVLDPDAVSQMVACMGDGIEGVTANIAAINANDNLLTRLIDSRYRHAFMVERAAQSYFGSVLCASGVATVYRRSFLLSVSGEWVSQKFLGQPVQFGDDRRLTGMALRRGRVIICLDALAITNVPTKPWNFFKQQLRWNKSFLRESFIFFREFGATSWPGFLSFTEVFFWLFYLSAILNLLVFDHFVGFISFLYLWIAYVLLAGIYRNITVLIRHPGLILFVPLYSLMHVVVLTPLRLIALVTILDNKWGTR